MALELYEDAYGDPRNATALALASEFAYLSSDQGAPTFRETFGMDSKLISVDNTQVYVAQNDKHILLAFRGSQTPTSLDGLKDWLLTNAVNLLIVPEGEIGTDFAAAGVGARFHKGFMGALAEIWNPLLAEVQAELAKKERPVWVTGHSLGGALALMAAWRLHRKFVPVHQVYTYGAPMIGNKEASEAFNKAFPKKVFRYINTTDLVPRLPTISLVANNYVHCDKEMGLSAAQGPVAAAASFLQGLVGRTVDGVLNGTLIDDIWASLQGRLTAHDIVEYRKLIGKG
jgi:hypothetical protein